MLKIVMIVVSERAKLCGSSSFKEDLAQTAPTFIYSITFCFINTKKQILSISEKLVRPFLH